MSFGSDKSASATSMRLNLKKYISGRGFEVGSICVYHQDDPNHYSQIGKSPTRPGADTSFWSPELDRYYVAAPAQADEEAAILVFQPQP